MGDADIESGGQLAGVEDGEVGTRGASGVLGRGDGGYLAGGVGESGDADGKIVPRATAGVGEMVDA